MASTSEVGHAKNVANLQDLIEFITAYGATYNPSKSNLQLPQILALKAAAETSLTEVIAKNTDFNTKVNHRVIAFSDVKPLSTRLVAALQTTDASEQTIDDAKTFNNKIQGKGSSAPKTPLNPLEPAPKTISNSQQSYDQLIQHFTGLKSVLESEPTYAPNETELQIVTLDTKITDFNQKNTAVAQTYTAVSNSRIARDKVLYTDQNSIYETAKEVKLYVKALFGANSPEFAQVKGIDFRKPKL
ncbi:hypothetical protein [Kaistella jeonii]|uniref:Uncharacterized protein n=1 Tax=Kaistella jeonii TaxID=266749 RepID=A0A0C1D385_9FLAO|nr:hypothetical protein [Kaistella jeonii]KIA88260.1 hypothetical protein OA86_12150 [Kaistella jeonii]SFC27328.1 hypothetical protein SAMN05421876_11191 [Kaistella jeonii]VEI95734.1 Uncharacterised protein [Kaistella jeonii]